MVRLYIVRHGDPDYDTDRENGGSLTDHGRKEAEALVHFFCGENEPTHGTLLSCFQILSFERRNRPMSNYVSDGEKSRLN
mmetsp:Transcript_2464/g.2703  ORF Transcript_2464/g.2703 Transcript_2464/m.2703 type:complete len:80 (+) Transcript_2464:42-281(+)